MPLYCNSTPATESLLDWYGLNVACCGDSHVLSPFLKHLEKLIHHFCWKSGWKIPCDLVEDCRQEVIIHLWTCRDKLEALPVAERKYYIATCAKHAIWRFIGHECRRQAGMISWEEVELIALQIDKCSEYHHGGLSCHTPGVLSGEQDDPDVNEILLGLPPLDSLIITLYYGEEWTDPEIARRLNLSSAAAKMRRHRILRNLRAQL